MERFLEIDNKVINVRDIRQVEFISDDIYLGLFPKYDDGNILVDFIPFTFANIHTFNKEFIELKIDLYALQEEETEEDWIKQNRSYINIQMDKLYEILNPIKITGMEYEMY